jgi:DNA-binding beta-propeller fold protein YncE
MWLVVVPALLSVAVSPARAETVVEAWSSRAFYGPSSVSVNPTDGSCWVADTDDSQVVHLSSAGAELWRSASGAFLEPFSVSANPTDGSCWVADTYNNQVVHLS